MHVPGSYDRNFLFPPTSSALASRVRLRLLDRGRHLGAVVGNRGLHRGQLLEEHGHLWERLRLQERGALADAAEEGVVRAWLHWGVAVLHGAAPGVTLVRRGAPEARASAVRVSHDLLAHVLADNAESDHLLPQRLPLIEARGARGAKEREGTERGTCCGHRTDLAWCRSRRSLISAWTLRANEN